MPIDVTCSGCGRTLRVPEAHVGKRAKCPQCETVFVVPAPGGEPAVTIDVDPFAPTNPSTREPTAFDFGRDAVADARSWYLRTADGQTYGPVPRSVLETWVEQGRVTPDSQVQADDDPDWKLARDVFPRWAGNQATPNRAPTTVAVGPPGSATDNPYLSPHAPFPTVERPGGRSLYQRPHRAGLVLTFGILSWVVLCVFFGIAAWVMGHSDLKEMSAGRMDNSGYGMTQAGMILGMIHSILTLGGFFFYMIVFIFVVLG